MTDFEKTAHVSRETLNPQTKLQIYNAKIKNTK